MKKKTSCSPKPVFIKIPKPFTQAYVFLSDELKPAHSKPKSDIYIVDEKWFNEKRIDVVYVPADRFGILGRFITKYMFDRESQKVHNQHEIQRKTSTKQKKG